MENRDRTSSEGTLGQEGPGQVGVRQPGKVQKPGDTGGRSVGNEVPLESDKPAARPTPSGVPNEGKAQDDRDPAGNLRGTAGNDEQPVGAGLSRDIDQNYLFRYPE